MNAKLVAAGLIAFVVGLVLLINISGIITITFISYPTAGLSLLTLMLLEFFIFMLLFGGIVIMLREVNWSVLHGVWLGVVVVIIILVIVWFLFAALDAFSPV